MSKPSENLADSAALSYAPHAPEFPPGQRTLLLNLAHDAIASGIAGSPLSDVPSVAVSSASSSSVTGSDWLLQPRGVFTTLYLGDQLRGCVGYAAPIRPLFRAVAETARAAAFEDSRFWPVTAEEAGELKISLSILSLLSPIRPEEVEVGRHGLVISDGMRRGLLLPQVSVEHGWDRETFLDQTCRKAGLPMDAWRRSATIEAFTAEVFGDHGLE